MTLTQADILKLAQLARLSLSDAETTKFQKDIDSILHYVAKISEVKANKLRVAKVKPNTVRADKVLNKFNVVSPFDGNKKVQEGLLVVPPVFKK